LSTPLIIQLHKAQRCRYNHSITNYLGGWWSVENW